MNRLKNSNHNADSKRNLYVVLCVLALLGVFGYGALSVVDSIMSDYSQNTYDNTKEIGVLGRTKYRFRALFRGSTAQYSHYQSTTKALPTMSPSHTSSYASSASAGAPSYTSNSLSAPMVSVSGTGLRTSSSASQHSYGGSFVNNSLSNISASRTTNNNASTASSPLYVSIPSSSLRTYAANVRISENPTTAPVAAGPRRVMVWDPELEDYVDDGSSSSPQEGDTKIEDGVVYVYTGGAWTPMSDQPDPGVPVGDLPIMAVLLFLASYVGVVVYRKKKAASLA